MTTQAQREIYAAARRQRLHLQATRFGNEVIIPVLTEYLETLSENTRCEVRKSPIDVVKTYGSNCEKIFRLLFTLYQVGGRSGRKCNYVTLWAAHHDNLKAYCKIITNLTGTEYTPKQVLDNMIDAGCTRSRRVKLGPKPEIISGQALEDYNRLVKQLRQFEREQQDHYNGTYWS